MARITASGDSWRRWQSRISRVVAILALLLLVVYGWQSRDVFEQVFSLLGPGQVGLVALLVLVGVMISAFTFVILVRSVGYPFSFQDGYHSLNLSQIAAMVPGKVWGFAGLAGLLLAHGIKKADSAFIIVLHTLLMLSGAVIVSIAAMIPTIGWPITLLMLLPVLVLLGGRNRWEGLRNRLVPSSSSLPDRSSLLFVVFIGSVSWVITSSAFALLVHYAAPESRFSLLQAGGAFAAGYVAGFLSLISPSGLGVREGVITLILGPEIGAERALAMALVFRFIHMSVLWANILLTLAVISSRPDLAASKSDTGGNADM